MAQLSMDKVKVLTSLSPEDITRTKILELFGKRTEQVSGKKGVKIIPSFMEVTDHFTVTSDMLPIVKKPTLTTAGLYLFNLVIVYGCFGRKFGYWNETLTSDNMESFLKKIVYSLIDKKVDIDEISKMYNSLIFLTSFCEIFAPAISTKFLSLPKEIKVMKDKLVAEKKDIIESGDAVRYTEEVEKPLLAETKKILMNEEEWPLMESNEGKFLGNNYKNNCITNGGLYDPINDRYVISTNAFMDGIEPDKYSSYANSALSGTYSRHVETRYGGAQTKYMFSAMQYSRLGERDSDCGTTRTIPIMLTKSNKSFYLFRYFVENGELKHLTSENIDSYVGKVLNFRTPLFCKSKNVCNHCFNSLYYDMGISNAGLTATRPTGTIMYIAMAAMHDSRVKVAKIDIDKYIKYVR